MASSKQGQAALCFAAVRSTGTKLEYRSLELAIKFFSVSCEYLKSCFCGVTRAKSQITVCWGVDGRWESGSLNLSISFTGLCCARRWGECERSRVLSHCANGEDLSFLAGSSRETKEDIHIFGFLIGNCLQSLRHIFNNGKSSSFEGGFDFWKQPAQFRAKGGKSGRWSSWIIHLQKKNPHNYKAIKLIFLWP